jgi:cytochrome oxidase Cu insertion factor (SCO1/SenC/PrrC family)
VALSLAGALGIMVGKMSLRPESSLPSLGQLPPFSLTERSGKQVTLQDLRGRPWIVQFVFTRCPGPCLTLAQNFKTFHDRLPNDSDLGFLTLTVDPIHDHPSALTAYAEKLGAKADRWWFLTGEKVPLYDLILKGFKLSVQENIGSDVPLQDMFIHSTRIVLIDPNGAIRGYYDGLDEGSYDQILRDLKSL